MKSKKSILFTLLTGVLLATAVEAGPPPIPETPASVDGLVYARAFKLSQSYEYSWSKDKHRVTEGYLLVLQVDPDLSFPRQTAEPVLYVGPRPAERINVGYESGHVVALVSGPLEKLDLANALMWYGTPELPERIDFKKAKEEMALAQEAGIRSFGKEKFDIALARGGETLKVKDHYELRWEAAELIRQYAPDESDLVAGLQVPRVEAAQTPSDSKTPKAAPKNSASSASNVEQDD